MKFFKKQVVIFVIFVLFIIFSTLQVYASNYGSGSYGNGSYTNGTDGNPVGAPGCNSTIPSGNAPWIYEADAGESGVTLRFINYQSPIDSFAVEYGTKSGNYIYGATNIVLPGESSYSYTINLLSLNTTYYFKVRAGNGCATGNWSNEVNAKTLGFITPNQLQINNVEIQPEQNSNNQAAQVPAKNNYTLNVTIVDQNKKPIKGANITLHSTPQNAETDSKGTATFYNVEAGNHIVLVAYNNFQGQQNINLTGNEKVINLSITIQMNQAVFSFEALIIIFILCSVIIILLLIILALRSRKK